MHQALTAYHESDDSSSSQQQQQHAPGSMTARKRMQKAAGSGFTVQSLPVSLPEAKGGPEGTAKPAGIGVCDCLVTVAADACAGSESASVHPA